MNSDLPANDSSTGGGGAEVHDLTNLQEKLASLQKALDDQLMLQRLLAVALADARGNLSVIEKDLKSTTSERQVLTAKRKQADKARETALKRARDEFQRIDTLKQNSERTLQLATHEMNQMDEQHKEALEEAKASKAEMEERISLGEVIVNDLAHAIASDQLIDVWRSRVEEVGRLIQEKQRANGISLVRNSLEGKVSTASSEFFRQIAQRHQFDNATSSSMLFSISSDAELENGGTASAGNDEDNEKTVKKPKRRQSAAAAKVSPSKRSQATTSRKSAAGAVLESPFMSSLPQMLYDEDDDGDSSTTVDGDQSYFVPDAGSSDGDVDYSDVKCSGCDDPSEEEPILLCDGCDLGFHLHCVNLITVPEGDWFCASCSANRTSTAETIPEASSTSSLTFSTSSQPHRFAQSSLLSKTPMKQKETPKKPNGTGDPTLHSRRNQSRSSTKEGQSSDE